MTDPVSPRRFRHWPSRLAVLVAPLAFVCAARADDAEEIVITAERRARAPQRVPISVTVHSGAALDASRVENSLDLPRRTPGLVFSTNSVLGQPYLRGVGSDILSAGADASIATFVDGVYQTRAVSAFQDFYDLERIEVLKGPQGMLFGRNTTGGTIHIVTRRPQPELTANADFLYGNFEKARVRGVLNVPLVGDRVVSRISGLGSWREGFTENVFLERDLDDEDLWALRGQLRIGLTDRASLLLRGDFAREESSRNLAPKIAAPLDANSGVQAGGTVPPGPRRVFNDTVNRAGVDAWTLSGELRWDLGLLSLMTLTAFRDTRYSQTLDIEATEEPVIVTSPHESSGAFSQELQLTSETAGPFEWMAGLYYLHEDASQIVDTSLATPMGSIRDRTDADLRADAFSVFGQVSYALASWRLTAGLRYSYEWRSMDFAEMTTGLPGVFIDASKDWDSWTPRFVVEYVPSEDVLLYVSAARGFKSGGFNSTVAQPEAFDPESLWAFEGGAKSSWLEGRARLDLAFFYYDYQDIQLSILSPLSVAPFPRVRNAGSATLWGLEASGRLRLLEGLELDASAAYLNSRFDNLQAIDPNDPDSDPDRSGNRLPRAPEFSFAAGMQYRFPLPFGSLIPRVEYRYQSKIFFNVFQDALTSQDGFSLWGARLAFESADGHWYVAAFAENLGDALYAQNNVRADGTFGNLFFWGAPRTYGFQVEAAY